MSSNGIKDRVAIVAMSCTPFREHFNLGRDDLMIDAAEKVLSSIGVTRQDIDAYWLGMAASGNSGIVLASVSFAAGVINEPFYACLVMLAIVTSLIAGSWLERVPRDRLLERPGERLASGGSGARASGRSGG